MENIKDIKSIAASVAALLMAALLFAPRAFAGDGAPVTWSVTNHLGKEVHSSSLNGKVTIVNFWATWCLPCLFEISDLHDVAKDYNKNVAVVGVSVDAKSNAMLAAYVDKFKMNYTVAMANPEILHGFHVGESVPMTFVLDQQGRIVRKHIGYVDKGELEKDIRSILKM